MSMTALNKKVSLLKQGDEDQEIQYCWFCKKKGEFKCGVCLQAVYCTPQHQKADWPSHKLNCIRPEDKLKQLYKQLMTYKRNFFDKLSKKLNIQSEVACENILKTSRDIVEKFPSPQHEIDYGSAVCSYVKIELIVKNFQNAQEVLNNYLKQRNDFLCDTSLIPEKINQQDPKFKKIIVFVEGKLKLLSVLSNLMHQIVRNSVYVIQILLQHCEKFYGPNSLELSNMYFQLANYYGFLNQLNKACACYLIAGKMRKQKGATSYFNAAIILMRNQEYKKAAFFFNECLEMIYKYGDPKSIIDRIYLALAYCNKKQNHFNATTEYLEKALCQLNLKSRFANQEQDYIRQILRMLSDQYKKQITGDQLSNLPRERTFEGQPQVIITNSNYNDLWELDNSYTIKKRDEEWKKSFKNQANKTKFQTKIATTNPLVEKVLFVNHFTDDKNQQLTALMNKSNMPTEYVHIDLQFMSKLTSTEVRFMNQLNRLLIQNKEKSAVYDIVENSNLMQQMNPEKRQRFYQLNPELIREKQEYNLMGQEQQQISNNGNLNNAPNENVRTSNKGGTQSKQSKGQKGFKLDLNKLAKPQN